MADLVGHKLAHFRVVAKLGEGGMGAVYEAIDDKLGRKVALKVLLEHFADSAERRQRFLREARSAAAVVHANVATLFEVGEDGGRVFIAMELVPGRTLRDVLERRVEIPEALRLAREVAIGLGRAHEQGIVHRDLKPENVMVTARGEVKILDFGLAKLHQIETPSVVGHADTAVQITREGNILGTPGYMSPEQARGERVDARSDVFALGVMLYELLTGDRPFSGPSAIAVLYATTTQEPAPVTTRNPQVTPQIANLVARCLEKDPAARYSSGDAIAEALAALVPQATMSRGSSSSVAASVPSSSRRPPGPMIAIAAAAAALAVIGLAWSRWARTPEGAPGPQATSESPLFTTRAVDAERDGGARGGRIIDWPPPRTSIPEAATAYGDALSALRDGNVAAAKDGFGRAVHLDPRLGAAYLRLALLGRPDTFTADRALLAKVTAVHESLDERDLALLRLAQAFRDGQAAPVDALVERFPRDAEVLVWAADFLPDTEKVLGRGELYERAITIDPGFALAYAKLATTQLWAATRDDPSRQNARAVEAADRCLARMPGSPACLLARADAHGLSGRCDAMERDADGLRAAAPGAPEGYAYASTALMNRGAPAPALAEMARQHAAAEPEAARETTRRRDAVALALHAGDFPSAEAGLIALEKDAGEAAGEYEHFAAFLLFLVYEEEGDKARALDQAEGYFRRMGAWPPHLGAVYVRLIVIAELERTGRISAHDAAAAVELWVDADPRHGAEDARLWLKRRAYPAKTPEEARLAMSEAPADLLPYPELWPQFRGALGRVLALAGESEEAIPYLRSEATWCGPEYDYNGVFDTFHALRRTQDHLLLGQALEKTGDRAGACEAYALLVERWGHARPRSVTAERARERARSLGCPR